ncbi:hypothetical protein BDDG_12581 [Blastomyces dermatitidis ATCC 18188]|nr:hypothetical protein BDDG_12581 [Blastomyces dermatitidis ATCC 18188]
MASEIGTPKSQISVVYNDYGKKRILRTQCDDALMLKYCSAIEGQLEQITRSGENLEGAGQQEVGSGEDRGG